MHCRFARTCLPAVGLAIVVAVGTARTARAQDAAKLPICTGWSDCNVSKWIGSPRVCKYAATPATLFRGRTVVSDFPDGVSSDGRGDYTTGADGVQWSVIVLNNAGLKFFYNKDSVKTPRSFTVNMNNPVPGGGGVPLGIITAESDDHLYAAVERVGDVSPGMYDLAIGQTATAAQMNVSFHLNGRFYILQMGPQPLGICHTDDNRINGIGTSSGTIHRAGRTKWVLDLPARSVGRLFDVTNTTQHAVDKGLYYLRMRYEISE